MNTPGNAVAGPGFDRLPFTVRSSLFTTHRSLFTTVRRSAHTAF
jgi:hypothetical protein